MIAYVPIIRSDELLVGNPDKALHHIDINGLKYPCGVVFEDPNDAEILARLPDVIVARVEFDEIPQEEKQAGIFFPRWFSQSRFINWF